MTFRVDWSNLEDRKKYKKIYNSKYYITNKEKIIHNNIEYQKNNISTIKEYKRIYYKKYSQRPEVKAKKLEYSRREDVKIRVKQRIKEHPELKLESLLKQCGKFGRIFGVSDREYIYLLIAWSRSIKKRDGACIHCGSTSNLEAHHELPKKNYPELTFVLNNGVTLCKECHYEVTYNSD